MNDAAKTLTIADIAHERGWSHVNAWRWLRDLERKHGVTLVVRRGRGYPLQVSAEALARITKVPVERELERVKERVAILEAEASLRDQRIDGISRDLIAFRRKSRDWFAGLGHRPHGAKK